MGRKCEILLCSNREGKNVGKSFYRFPRESERCKQWILICGSSELTARFTLGGSEAVRKLKICSDHFHPSSFRSYVLPEKGLKEDAIPSAVSCHVESINRPDTTVNITDESFEYEEVEYLDESMESLYEDIEYIDDVEMEESQADDLFNQPDRKPDMSMDCESSANQFEFSVIQNLTAPGIEGYAENCENNSDAHLPSNDDTIGTPGQSTDKSITIDYKLLYEKEKETNLLLHSSTDSMKQALRKSKRKSAWRLKSNKNLRKQNRLLKFQVKRLQKGRSKDSTLANLVRENPVLHNTLLNSTRKPKGRRYYAATKKFAIGAYLASPATYRFIQRSSVMHLPSKMSLNRWNSDVHMRPGLNEPILNRLCANLKNASKKERAVTISIDGMAVKPELTYNAKNDTFVGFPDDGRKSKYEKNNPLVLATEAVVVMVSGITPMDDEHFNTLHNTKVKGNTKRFKQVTQQINNITVNRGSGVNSNHFQSTTLQSTAIGYVLAHHTMGSEKQLQLVKDTIIALDCRGFHPLVLAMDQCTTNVKMFHEAGASEKNPIVSLEGHEIAFMFDTPHLLKNAKSMLMKHNAVFKGEISSFKHIRQLYDVDHSSTPRLVPKLKEKFINQAPFVAMNVAQATRTLSNSVAVGIEYYVEVDELPLAALRTAVFARFFDKLFDTFNCRNSNSVAKPYRACITENSCHWDFLDYAVSILSKMHFTSKECFSIKKAKQQSKCLTKKQRNPNFLGGFLGNIQAIKWLFRKLKEEFGCQTLCCNYLCQDCIENLFSEIRRRCGRNDAPNAHQFAAAFKYAALSAAKMAPEGSNCKPDTAVPACAEDDVAYEEANTAKPRDTFNFKYKCQPLNTKLSLTPREVNGLAYILGAMIRKLKHETCRKQITLQSDAFNANNPMYRFCQLKNACCYPGSAIFEIGLKAFQTYKQFFVKFLHQNRRNVKTRLKKYIEYGLYKEVICISCFEALIDKIFNVLIQCFLRDSKNKLQAVNRSKRMLAKGKRNRKALRMNLQV